MAGPVRHLLLQPAFLICASLMAVVAIGDGLVADYMRVVIHKEALPLRAPLRELNRSALGPYQFERASDIDPATVEALGTKEYIFWNLTDTSVETKDPCRQVVLAVTYYTGDPDLAPHTPDVCYRGSGYLPKVPHESRQVTVRSLPSDEKSLPIRVLTFVKSTIHDRDESSVVYTFHTNGRFAVGRDEVLGILNSPQSVHEYYCKIEASFYNDQIRPHEASREATVTAANKLFEVLLPELLKNHIPDWNAAESALKGDPSATPAMTG